MAIANRQERYEAEHEKRMALYRMGMTDAQIAAALELSVATIQAWRRREKLPPNRAPKRSGVAQPAPANHPWRDRQQDPKHPVGPPTVDAVTQAAATCDAMAAARLAEHRALTDFPVMLRVEIPTGRILVDRRPWWLRRDTSNA